MRYALSLFLTLAIAGAAAGAAGAADVRTSEYCADDGSRVLRQDVVVNAPVAEVWKAFTTTEGWESWAVPFAHVDLAVGGLIETAYDPAAKQGDAGNIHNRILSFLPRRMLSIQAVKAPPDFEYTDLLPSLHSVIEFEALDDARTRVSISGVGYRDGDGYDALLEFFRQGNAWSFERLARRFDEGPLDWHPAVPEASPHAADHEVNTEDNTSNNGE